MVQSHLSWDYLSKSLIISLIIRLYQDKGGTNHEFTFNEVLLECDWLLCFEMSKIWYMFSMYINAITCHHYSYHVQQSMMSQMLGFPST